jgi:small subunit ribosomal protein S6
MQSGEHKRLFFEAPKIKELLMSLYEHVFISRQDLSISQAEGLIEHFSTILSENGGKVLSQEYWGLKTMAYKINKNRKGHYVLLKSDSPPEAVEEMERLMRLHEDIMRVMTIKVKIHEEGPSAVMQSKARGEERVARKPRQEF